MQKHTIQLRKSVIHKCVERYVKEKIEQVTPPPPTIERRKRRKRRNRKNSRNRRNRIKPFAY